MAQASAISTPAWIHDLTFVAAIALPEASADEFGTTINGMWADPGGWTTERVAAAHARGRRILVSVPLIALTHDVYERDELAYLKDEICRDIHGGLAEVEWYYWDAKPVFALCIHSPVVRAYLVDRLRGAIEAGVDVVNVDEINTSVGLMTRQPKGSGYCGRCLRDSTTIRDATRARDVSGPADDEVRAWLRDDLHLNRAFEVEQQARAFRNAERLLGELRALAREHAKPVSITANVAGLGAFVGNHGPLWSAMWGELLDVIMLEAIYVVSQSQFEDPHAHKLLPRGTFAPLYRLGRALGPHAPIWIAPQINVPRQLAGQRRQRYYELMFLEAYANRGRWGYNWWPGVDDATRREATAPDAIKTWTAFMRAHRDLYVGLETANDIAVVYSNAAVLAEPTAHYRYLALAQALYEAGVQFDVIYTGDEQFAAAPLDVAQLAQYRLLIVPDGDRLSPSQAAALDVHAKGGGAVMRIASGSSTGKLLDRFWAEYRLEDRASIIAAVGINDGARIHVSVGRVVATRYVGPTGATLVHLLNCDYRADRDEVEPGRDVVLRLPWDEDLPTATFLSPTDERNLDARLDGEMLEVKVPVLIDHAVVEIVG